MKNMTFLMILACVCVPFSVVGCGGSTTPEVVETAPPMTEADEAAYEAASTGGAAAAEDESQN